MKKKNLPIYEKVEILDIASEGKAIARVNEMVVFVSDCIPGDIVDIQITKKKSNYREGKPINFHQYSDKRVNPVCEHFGVCGGCVWQNLDYKHQLYYKQKQVTDALQRIGKIDISDNNIFHPILASENVYYYRNKLEYSFSNLRWQTKEEFENRTDHHNLKGLGFHVPKMFDKVVDIKHCFLQKEPSNQIRLAVKAFTDEQNYPYINLRNHEGYMRNLVVRTSTTGETMLIFGFNYEDEDKRKALLNHVVEKFPDIKSLQYVINPKYNDSFLDLEVKTYYGNDFIYEEMEGLKFKISPKSFYQTNSEQAYNLYKIVRNYAQLTGTEIVYDLYTGTGTIANFVAHQSKKVIGVEYVEEAVRDARINASINHISNTEFFAGDLKDVLTKEFIDFHGKPQVMIIDPPRAGMLENVVKNVLYAEPERIVYVSCNPATQARDINWMSEKYSVTQIQPVDMFPHTQHVENVVLLEKK